jgi:hypothetical protein
MAYIGHSASGNFTTKPSKDTFSGNASTTAFTLSEGATTNTVDVFVNNVRQEPTTAYTVDGTTLTFTAAPGSGTNNIYVVNRGPLQLSATHPAAQALKASTGTFTGALSGAAATFTGDLTVDTSTLKVDSTNNRVGVGTASPSAPLSILSTNGLLNVQNGNTSNGTKIQTFVTAGNANGYLAIEGHTKEYVRFDADGLKFNGDTAAANALDDYEEGTFTPVFDQSSTAISGVVTDVNTGKYTKIGNKVTVQIYLHTTAAGSPTPNALTVGDLPFVAANVSNVHPSISIGYVAGFATANPTTGFMTPNTDYIRLFTTASGDARTNSATMIGTYLGSDTYLILNATYLTN